MENEAGMRCPKCGAAMNHHADKLLQVGPDARAEVMEFHECPACGTAAARQSSGQLK